ncbi:MAG: DoxX family protein [Alphaproteobacteria bacterium]|nr:DoxX family protein [Alphaproteobacteria bacterium]
MISAARLSVYSPWALAALRIITALLFLSHALVKLLGFPPGAQPGPQPLLGLLGIAAVIELVTGILILFGWLTRPAAFVAAGEMAVAYWLFHAPNNFYPVLNMGEAAILFCFIFLYLVFAGPGALSIDARARLTGQA